MSNWPNNKRFAFTIIDDTDGANIENIKPVYDFLRQLGIYTTKTVWVYKSNDQAEKGQALDNKSYLEFIKQLKNAGFEIALHGVGSGEFSHEQISSGLDIFNSEFGNFPVIQINHSVNPDNLYWGDKRYVFPLKHIIKIFSLQARFYGDDDKSDYFWGNLSKKYIKFIRNHCFNGINTFSYDYKMPYKIKEKDKYSNYWFSSSDGHTIEEFSKLLAPRNVDLLEKQGGACIVYTHFASGFVKNGRLNDKFVEQMHYLAQKGGWFVPAGALLDYLLTSHNDHYVSYWYLLRLDLLWGIDRLMKKIIFKR